MGKYVPIGSGDSSKDEVFIFLSHFPYRYDGDGLDRSFGSPTVQLWLSLFHAYQFVQLLPQRIATAVLRFSYRKRARNRHSGPFLLHNFKSDARNINFNYNRHHHHRLHYVHIRTEVLHSIGTSSTWYVYGKQRRVRTLL